MILNAYLYDANVVSFGSMYTHPELSESLPKYERIRDCLGNRIKAKGEIYLKKSVRSS